MNMFLAAVISATLAVTLAQYQPGTGTGGGAQYSSGSAGQVRYNDVQYSSDGTKKIPFSAILNQKQSLSADGAFNFAFSADNGLQQGESINPDGTRKGSYSYVDPSGKTITVKYEAGKDGFRILESPFQQPSAGAGATAPVTGSAVPYTISQYKDGIFPVNLAARPQAQLAPAQPAQYYNPGAYSRGPAQFPAQAGGYQQAAGAAVQPRPAPVARPYAYPSKPDEVEDYKEDPNAPHSFGPGYSFEFAG